MKKIRSNQYIRTAYTQGGKPHDCLQGVITLWENGFAKIEEFENVYKVSWKKPTDQQLIIINEKGEVIYTFYTYKNRSDSLFSYGSRLTLIKPENFSIRLSSLTDNPQDPLNAIVIKTHPNVIRISSRKDEMLELMPKNSIVAEIGVNFGNYAEDILDRTNPRKLHLIDCWQEQDSSKTSDIYQDEQQKEAYRIVLNKFREKISSNIVVMNKGLSQDVLNMFGDSYFDWVYIDASHRFEDCMNDLKLCRKKVKDGGLIAGHDYCNSSLTKHRNYQVKKAVDTFCRKYEWEMIYLTIEHPDWPFHSYVLRQKSH